MNLKATNSPRINKTLQIIFASDTKTPKEHDIVEKIEKARCLIIGSGGIGCELVKSLSMAGFRHFATVDYDYVDVSNLNRQFLYTSYHATHKIPKALALKESSEKMFPNIEVEAHVKNIYELDETFYKRFDLIFCAIDNVEGREYISSICIKLDKPLFDAGTQGLYGQVRTQIKGFSECYLCRPRPKEEKAAVCTIRTVPSEPIHVVYWGKILFNNLFGKIDEESVWYETVRDRAEFIHLKPEVQLEKAINLFNKLFYEMVIQSISIENQSSSGLRPIKYEEGIKKDDEPQNIENKVLKQQRLLTIAECSKLFVDSYIKCQLEVKDQEKIDFDKENRNHINFLTSASNLRIYNFINYKDSAALEYQSPFQIKEKAGDIIPTISSTNSIAAGIQTIEAIKYLRNQFDKLQLVWISPEPDRLFPVDNTPPVAECQICSSGFYPEFEISSGVRLKDFFEYIKIRKNITKANIIIENIIYDSEEEDESMMELYSKNMEDRIVRLFEVHNKKENPEGGILIINSSNDLFYYCSITIKKNSDDEIIIRELNK